MPQNSFLERNLRKVYVDEMIVDLVPSFIKTRKDDLKALALALKSDDFEKVKRIGHNWKGVGSTYGFHYLSMAGERFEILAYNHDRETLAELIESLPDYLANIEIECKPNYEKMKMFIQKAPPLDV